MWLVEALLMWNTYISVAPDFIALWPPIPGDIDSTISVLLFVSLLFKAYFVYMYICIMNQVMHCISLFIM